MARRSFGVHTSLCRRSHRILRDPIRHTASRGFQASSLALPEGQTLCGVESVMPLLALAGYTYPPSLPSLGCVHQDVDPVFNGSRRWVRVWLQQPPGMTPPVRTRTTMGQCMQ
ncbi:hypothetical protein MRX96_000603 [Rhipicephalus microplus]